MVAKVPAPAAVKLFRKTVPSVYIGVTDENAKPKLRLVEPAKLIKLDVNVTFCTGVEAVNPAEVAPWSPDRSAGVVFGVTVAVNKFLFPLKGVSRRISIVKVELNG